MASYDSSGASQRTGLFDSAQSDEDANYDAEDHLGEDLGDDFGGDSDTA
jgi:hypothetical protein